MSPETARAYRLLSRILDYPTSETADEARDCAVSLRGEHPEAAARLAAFHGYARETPLDRLQELYTVTFDLQVKCYPYAGYHLFGESYKRGEFMALLRERFRAHGFDAGNELPDHLRVLLRFLVEITDEAETQTLIDECLAPATVRMARAFKDSENPYGEVIRALEGLMLAARCEEWDPEPMLAVAAAFGLRPRSAGDG